MFQNSARLIGQMKMIKLKDSKFIKRNKIRHLQQNNKNDTLLF